jgi:hypothetical protein
MANLTVNGDKALRMMIKSYLRMMTRSHLRTIGRGCLRRSTTERALARRATTRERMRKIWIARSQGGSNHSRTSLEPEHVWQIGIGN